MALSNIFREPRRELIEQGYGLIGALILLPIWLGMDALVVRAIDGTIAVPLKEWAAGAFIAIFPMLGILVIALLMHWLGEAIRNGMAARGRDPRPKTRV